MIEIEYKYVMDMRSFDLEFATAFLSAYAGYKIQSLTQLYLPGSGRVRELKGRDERFDPTTYEFTYKDKLKTAGNLEVNCTVDEEFFKISETIATIKLRKHRITFYSNDFKWELDFFFDDEGVYFVMMECEVESADIIPDLSNIPVLGKFVLLNVELDDNNFTSKKMSSREYAENLYKKVVNNEYSK